jgi:hypothetical protein
MTLLRSWKRPVAAAALVAAGLLAGAAGDASAAPSPPAQQVCTTPLTISFIELVRTVDGPAVRVTGIKPYHDTSVVLVPENVDYVQAPDYWNYFIQGCGGTGAVTKVPFSVVLPINGPIGKYGIAIGGRTFDLVPGGPATS